MGNGKNAVSFFPDVVKNIASSNLEIRKLVYIFLVRYADHEPDLALLSINTIQKSLTDENPVIRALAVRVISGIRVLSIVQIVCLGIKKCSHDPSPIVRRAAAVAINKCYELDYSNGPMLLELLEKLLADNNPEVVSAALVTFKKSFPDRLDLLHGVYRKLCRMLAKLNEWGQAAALDMLVKYARIYLPKPETLKLSQKQQDVNDALDPFFSESTQDYEQFDDDDDEIISAYPSEDIPQGYYKTKLDPDLELLFIATRPLLFSRNSSVIMAAAHTYFYLGNHQIFDDYQVAGPVVQLLRSDISIQYLTLVNIKIMTLTRRESFAPFLKHFFLFPSDIFLISKLKLEILTLLCTHENVNMIVSELKYYALTSNDKQTVAESIQAIGRCIMVSPDNSSRILRWLLQQVKSNNQALVSESLNVIRYIILRDPTQHILTISRLARLLDQVSVDSAKESIIWLVGEFAGTAQNIAPDVLRKCAKSFASESTNVRYQIVLLAAKVYSYYLDRNKPVSFTDNDGETPIDMPDDGSPESCIPKLFSYVMLLARYDGSYDTRDRARLFSTLLTLSASTELATLILQVPKPCPVTSLREIMRGSNNKIERSKVKLAQAALSEEDFSVDTSPTIERISDSPPLHAPVSTVPIINLLLGSPSLVLGHPVDGFQSLPEWTAPGQPLLADPSVRDDAVPDLGKNAVTSISHVAMKNRNLEAASNASSFFGSNKNLPTNSNGGQKFKEQTLDEFFADVQSEEEASSSDESSSEEEDSSEEESSEEEGESEDEDEGEEDEEESEEESSGDEKSNLISKK